MMREILQGKLLFLFYSSNKTKTLYHNYGIFTHSKLYFNDKI